MKNVSLLSILFLISFNVSAQCPDLIAAMVNACNRPAPAPNTEGNNEFVLFNTDIATSSPVSAYRIFYGTGNPPVTNAMAGSDAFTKTGTGTVTALPGCTIIEVTDPTTVIPGGSKVMFIPAGFDTAYDITSFCAGTTVYVTYIRINSAGGSNSSWASTGTLANTPAGSRFLQVTYSGSPACNGTSAPVKSYVNGWSLNADGNFLTWNGATPVYTNNGCSNIILPIHLTSFTVNEGQKEVFINWKTENEKQVNYYTVEESADGVVFYEKNRVAAKGGMQNEYSLTISKPAYSKAFYRIKQTDADGKYFYSGIISFNLFGKTGIVNVSVLQNPITGTMMTLKFESPHAENASIKISNGQGSILIKNTKTINPGITLASIDINRLSPGIYFVIGEINGKQFHQKFIKQ